MFKMPKKINYNDYIGTKINRLTIKSFYRNEKNNRVIFICKCDCGNEKHIYYNHVLNGNTQSCGCLGYKKRLLNLKKHWENARIYEEKCEFCGKKEHYAKGYCRACYSRILRKGTPEYRELLHKKIIPLNEEQTQKALNVIYTAAPILTKNKIIGHDSIFRFKKGRKPKFKTIKRCFDFLGFDIFEELNIDEKYNNERIYKIY